MIFLGPTLWASSNRCTRWRTRLAWFWVEYLISMHVILDGGLPLAKLPRWLLRSFERWLKSTWKVCQCWEPMSSDKVYSVYCNRSMPNGALVDFLHHNGSWSEKACLVMLYLIGRPLLNVTRLRPCVLVDLGLWQRCLRQRQASEWRGFFVDGAGFVNDLLCWAKGFGF